MKKIIIIASLFAPALVFAATDLMSLLGEIQNLLAKIVPIIFVLGLLVFFWGLAKFVFSAGNEDAIAEGKKLIFWGIIALFIMASIWGIIVVLRTTFGVDMPLSPSQGQDDTRDKPIPQIETAPKGSA